MPLGMSRPSMEKADSRKPSLTRRMSSQISMARLEIRKSVFDLIGARTACSASAGALFRTCRSPARRRPLAGKPLPALPENWKSATDSEGRTYFWNEISNATTYSYPPHLPEGWHLARLRSDPNVVYFYNEWTRQTVKCDRPKPRARAPADRRTPHRYDEANLDGLKLPTAERPVGAPPSHPPPIAQPPSHPPPSFPPPPPAEEGLRQLSADNTRLRAEVCAPPPRLISERPALLVPEI